MVTTTSDTKTTPLSGASLEDRVDKAADSAHGALDKAEAAAEEAADAVRPFLSRATQAAHQKVDEVAAAVKPAAGWFAEKNEALSTAGRHAEEDARQFISSHPWQSVLVAAGIGYLLGRLGGRR